MNTLDELRLAHERALRDAGSLRYVWHWLLATIALLAALCLDDFDGLLANPAGALGYIALAGLVAGLASVMLMQFLPEPCAWLARKLGLA